MKILHLCLYGAYTDRFSYQENILPRYHVKLGHDVVVIARNVEFDYSGELKFTSEKKYRDKYGVKVYRLAYQKIISNKFTKFFGKVPLYNILLKEYPDIIFIHDAQLSCVSYFDVKKYINRINKNAVVVGDVHSDVYNAGLADNKRRISIKSLFFSSTQLYFRNTIYPIYKKVYCVAQSSYEYAVKVCHIPKEKLKLLPLGFDTDLIESKMKNYENIRNSVFSQYGIKDEDIVIVHGGKLDKNKKTVELIDSIKKLNNERVKLFIFGGIAKEYKSDLLSKINQFDWIIYSGPLSQDEYYDVFLSCDIAVFPGGQSSLWQEAVGCGLPLLIYYRDGVTRYLNRCGNADFIYEQSVDGIYETLNRIITEDNITKMKIAAKKATKIFSYRDQAQIIIDDCFKEYTDGGKRN